MRQYYNGPKHLLVYLCYLGKCAREFILPPGGAPRDLNFEIVFKKRNLRKRPIFIIESGRVTAKQGRIFKVPVRISTFHFGEMQRSDRDLDNRPRRILCNGHGWTRKRWWQHADMPLQKPNDAQETQLPPLSQKSDWRKRNHPELRAARRNGRSAELVERKMLLQRFAKYAKWATSRPKYSGRKEPCGLTKKNNKGFGAVYLRLFASYVLHVEWSVRYIDFKIRYKCYGDQASS